MAHRLLRIKVKVLEDGVQVIYQGASPRGTYFTTGGVTMNRAPDGGHLDKEQLILQLNKVMLGN